MANLQTQSVAGAGSAITFASAANGDKIVKPETGTFLLVFNGDGSDHTVSIDDPNTAAPAGATTFNPDFLKNIVAGTYVAIPLSKRFANKSDSGKAALVYSAVTSMKVAVVKFGR